MSEAQIDLAEIQKREPMTVMSAIDTTSWQKGMILLTVSERDRLVAALRKLADEVSGNYINKPPEDILAALGIVDTGDTG